MRRLHGLFSRLRNRQTVVPIFGLAWYRADQWARLRDVSVDADQLEDTHEQWLKNAELRYTRLENEGKKLEKIMIDVDDLAAWCRELGRKVDGAGRTAYTTYRMQSTRGGLNLPSNHSSDPTPKPFRLL